MSLKWSRRHVKFITVSHLIKDLKVKPSATETHVGTEMKITDLVMPGWLEIKNKYINQVLLARVIHSLIKACKVLLIKESSFSCSLL